MGLGGRGLIVVFGDIREGCNCTGRVAIWEKALCEVFPSLCSLLKKKREPLSKQCAGCLSAFPSEIQSSRV